MRPPLASGNFLRYHPRVAYVRVKICGVCRVADAQLAAEAGADAVGMIFHPPSKRHVELETAKAIGDAVGPFVGLVGVFVNAATGVILQTAAEARLRVVQLHGEESPEQVLDLAGHGLGILKAVRVDGRLSEQMGVWRTLVQRSPAALSGIVLETGNTPHAGGSGVANDFEAIRRHMDAGVFANLPPVIVAGGLSPENVRGVVGLLRPYAVDVSSGVEEALRIKSAEKVRRFIAEARA